MDELPEYREFNDTDEFDNSRTYGMWGPYEVRFYHPPHERSDFQVYVRGDWRPMLTGLTFDELDTLRRAVIAKFKSDPERFERTKRSLLSLLDNCVPALSWQR